MGWEMWVLMLVGIAGFWAVVVMVVRVIFPVPGDTVVRLPRRAPHPAAHGTAADAHERQPVGDDPTQRSNSKQSKGTND